MTKEEFKTRLLEQQIFDELKDGYFGGINYIRVKYEGTGIDFSRLYRRIVNYRIATYGTAYLDNPSSFIYKSKEECMKKSENAKQRRYYRRTRNENK